MESIDLKSLNLTIEESRDIINFITKRRGISTEKLLSTIKPNLKCKNTQNLTYEKPSKLTKTQHGKSTTKHGKNTTKTNKNTTKTNKNTKKSKKNTKKSNKNTKKSNKNTKKSNKNTKKSNKNKSTTKT